MTSVLVHDFLLETARRSPDKVALVVADRRLTFAQIDEQTNRLANALVQHGVRRGDRVAIYLHNSVETVVAIFAVLKAGGTFVVVNHTTKQDKLTYILNDCRATAAILDSRVAQRGLGASLLADVGSLRLLIVCGSAAAEACVDRSQWLDFNALLQTSSPQPLARVNIDLDLACLIYTSGTTGEPKGVMSDHSNVVFAASSIIEYLGNNASDIVLNVLPLSFDYGLYQLLMAFKFGGTLVLEPSFAYPATILRRIEQERVTGFPGVPTIFSILVQTDLAPYDLSTLRYVTNTAAALPPSHILNLRQKLPGVTIYSMYGLTETKRTLYLPPDQLDVRPDSVGIPIPGTECWVEDSSGRRLRAGEVGELVVRGRHVMRGYWEAAEATAQRFRPGAIPGERLCYTGDLFRRDEEGYFYFVGRSDDIIKSRGEKVAPKEVENVLYALPGVVEAVVVGVPDAILGRSIKAILVVDPASRLTSAQVLAHCRGHLEDFMVPQHVEFRDALPKTSSGKIKRNDAN